MKLTSLDIQRLPGLAEGFRLDDLDREVTLITGPNAAGKSSVVRALRLLLTPPQGDDPPVVIVARFDAGDREYQVERMGGRVTWSREGVAVPAPAQINPTFLRCYWLGVEDLLAAAKTDHAIAREMLTALSGGFDLHAVRAQPPFHLARGHGRAEARALQQAETELREARVRQRTWVEQEQQLPELERRARASRGAARRAQALRRALALLDSRRDCAQIEARLADYPANMQRLRGDEAQRETELREEIRRLETEQAEAGQAAERARRDIEAAGPGETPDAERLEALDIACQDLARDEQRLEQAASRLAQAEAVLRDNPLHGGTDEGGGDAPPLTAGLLNEIGELADRVARHQAATAALEQRLGEPVDDPGENAVERLTLAVDALREWLRLPDPAMLSRWRVLAWTALVLGVVGGIFAALAVIDGQTPRWVLSPAILLAAMGGFGLYALRGDSRKPAQARFEACGLEQPAWHIADVNLCLTELEQRLQAARRAREAAHRRREIERELARARAELDQSLEARQRLSQRLGLPAHTHGLGQAAYVAALKALTETRARRAEAAAEVEQLSTGLQRRRLLIARTLQHLNAAPAGDDTADMRHALSALKRRVAQVQQTARELENHSATMERAGRELDRRRQQLAALYAGTGLDPRRADELHARLRRLSAWQKEMKALADQRAVAASRRAEIDDADDLAKVEQGDRAGLEQALAAAEDEEAASRAAVEELANLRARLEHASRDTGLARARAARDAARSALQTAWRAACLAQVGQLLLDTVEQEFTTRHQPAVLEDARRLFGEFTHYAFDFEPDSEHGLLARDTIAGETRSIQTLSAGTRMQLLLALRVAWVRHLEQGGAPWPLVLDEALTTSDPARFTAVVQALHTLVTEEGRQIIYLTAQPADVLLWERAAGHRPPVIDLGQLRFQHQPADAGEYRLPDESTPPPPGDATPEDYAVRLGVPPLNPFLDAGQVPLFYLMRDRLELLHRLHTVAAIRNLGQLRALLVAPGAARLIGEQAVRRELAARIGVTRRWLAIWQRGRGRRVNRAVLETADGVSDTMLERVAAAADAVNGDAAALLAALETGVVKGYRAAARDQLADWLRTEGYLVPAPVADADQRRRETAMQLDDDIPDAVIDSQITWLEAAVASAAP